MGQTVTPTWQPVLTYSVDHNLPDSVAYILRTVVTTVLTTAEILLFRIFQ
jgi:hypothetical protein